MAWTKLLRRRVQPIPSKAIEAPEGGYAEVAEFMPKLEDHVKLLLPKLGGDFSKQDGNTPVEDQFVRVLRTCHDALVLGVSAGDVRAALTENEPGLRKEVRSLMRRRRWTTNEVGPPTSYDHTESVSHSEEDPQWRATKILSSMYYLSEMGFDVEKEKGRFRRCRFYHHVNIKWPPETIGMMHALDIPIKHVVQGLSEKDVPDVLEQRKTEFLSKKDHFGPDNPWTRWSPSTLLFLNKAGGPQIRVDPEERAMLVDSLKSMEDPRTLIRSASTLAQLGILTPKK